jgi:hypothetical protein
VHVRTSSWTRRIFFSGGTAGSESAASGTDDDAVADLADGELIFPDLDEAMAAIEALGPEIL